jgi:hypothetical protein
MTERAEETHRLDRLIDAITESFREAIVGQTKDQHERERYAIPEIRTAIAYAVVQLFRSNWYAARPDFNMWDRPVQYEDELAAFIDDLHMAFDDISSPDE